MSARGAVAVLVIAGSAACGPGSDVAPRGADPTTLAVAGASNPTLAPGPDASTYVSWVGAPEGTPDVHLARLGADGSLRAAPVRVNDTPGDAAAHGQAPARVVSAGDTVWVVWANATPVEGRRFPASDLRIARSTDGGQSFGRTTTVNAEDGGMAAGHNFHDALVGPGGTLIVSWLDGRARWEAVARETGWTEGEPPPSDAESEALVARHGHGVVADGPEVRVVVSRDGGESFATRSVVDAGACPCCRTHLTVGPEGALYVAWRKVFEGDVRDVVVARSEDLGRSWSDPMRVHADDWVFPGCPHAGPGLVAGPDGTLHATWYTGKEGASGLFYAASSDEGRSFSPPVRLVARGFVPPSQARLAARSDGSAVVAWEDRDEAGEPIVSVASVSDGAVGPARSWPGSLPALAGGETVWMAWLDGEAVRAVRVR